MSEGNTNEDEQGPAGAPAPQPEAPAVPAEPQPPEQAAQDPAPPSAKDQPPAEEPQHVDPVSDQGGGTSVALAPGIAYKVEAPSIDLGEWAKLSFDIAIHVSGQVAIGAGAEAPDQEKAGQAVVDNWWAQQGSGMLAAASGGDEPKAGEATLEVTPEQTQNSKGVSVTYTKEAALGGNINLKYGFSILSIDGKEGKLDLKGPGLTTEINWKLERTSFKVGSFTFEGSISLTGTASITVKPEWIVKQVATKIAPRFASLLGGGGITGAVSGFGAMTVAEVGMVAGGIAIPAAMIVSMFAAWSKAEAVNEARQVAHQLGAYANGIAKNYFDGFSNGVLGFLADATDSFTLAAKDNGAQVRSQMIENLRGKNQNASDEDLQTAIVKWFNAAQTQVQSSCMNAAKQFVWQAYKGQYGADDGEAQYGGKIANNNLQAYRNLFNTDPAAGTDDGDYCGVPRFER